jgi:predicted nuclease of predicted toxin-antitoxin system
MNFLADESLDFPIITYLRNEGLNLKSVAEENPSIDDEQVLDWANTENRILITLDKDFGELVFRLRKVHAGVILLRLDEVDIKTKIKLLLQVIEKDGNSLKHSFTVIQENLIRIRHHLK